MSESRHIIGVIEDDPVHRTLLETTLESAGYRVISAASAADFRRQRNEVMIDLLLLDWHLPEQSGLDLTRNLRDEERNPVPIIFITREDDEQAISEALLAGADDFVVKPFRRRELLARIHATLRRSYQPLEGCLDFPPYTLMPEKRVVMIGDRAIKATPKQFDLLAFLFQRARQTCSRASILAHVWHTSPDLSTRTVDTHVSRLKKQFELDGRNGWVLEGLYQQGYQLRPLDAKPDDEASQGQ
ncbi:MAG: response regulator transcription factor [Wenzhouxiangella sp.]